MNIPSYYYYLYITKNESVIRSMGSIHRKAIKPFGCLVGFRFQENS